jgi:hypothetical protein
MVFRLVLPALLGAAGVAALAPQAFAQTTLSPLTARALGTGGAMRGFATGDSGPQLNPSGISLLRAYSVEGSYLYDSVASSQDVRLSAVDSTSAFNLGGALYYDYHHDSPTDSTSRSSHLFGASLSFPILDKVFLGASANYLRFTDATGTTNTGFTFDAGITVRPVSMLSVGAVSTNLFDKGLPWAPRTLGGGLAFLPIPTLILFFDTVWQKVYDSPYQTSTVTSYMGGGEFSFAGSAAFRLGGGRDGLSKNGYLAGGISVLSAEIGALDVGVHQDVSGTNKATIVGVSARIFVPSM